MLPFQFLLSPCHHLGHVRQGHNQQMSWGRRNGGAPPPPLTGHSFFRKLFVVHMAKKMNSRATSRSTNRINHKSIDSSTCEKLLPKHYSFLYTHSPAPSHPSENKKTTSFVQISVCCYLFLQHESFVACWPGWLRMWEQRDSFNTTIKFLSRSRKIVFFLFQGFQINKKE